MCLLFDFSPSHASCSVNAILNLPGGKLLSLLSVVTQCWCVCCLIFSPSHASCSVNAILNLPGGKLLSLLSVVTQC